MIHIKQIGALFGMLSLVGTMAGCAADSSPEDTEAPKDVPSESTETRVLMENGVDHTTDGEMGVQVVITFHQTCTNPYVEGVGNAATYASASSCRRRDGSWTGFRSWSGYCTGNLNNNNGNIQCN